MFLYGKQSMEQVTVPLIVHGKDVTACGTNKPLPVFTPYPEKSDTLALSATPQLCIQAIESCASAFKIWKHTLPTE